MSAHTDNERSEAAVDVPRLVGHVCFYCHSQPRQTADNPSRTDWCMKCGHRGEGVQRAMEKREWGVLHILPNADCDGTA